MKTCKHCGGSFSASHYCPTACRSVDYSDSSDFLLSAIIAYETDNAMLGAMAGGDIAGAIIGEAIADSCVDSSPIDNSGW